MNSLDLSQKAPGLRAPRKPTESKARHGATESAASIRKLFAAIDNESSLRHCLAHVSQVLVSLFDAEVCTVSLSEQGRVATSSRRPAAGEVEAIGQGRLPEFQMESALDRISGSKASAILPFVDLRTEVGGFRVSPLHGHAMVSPIVAAKSRLGTVVLMSPAQNYCFDPDDLQLLDTITLYLGQVLHARRMRDLLDSRLLHLAMPTDVARTVNQIRMGSVPALDKMTRIVAKSFFREMTKAGFGSHQIIRAATEIISELHNHLQKRPTHQKELRSPVPAESGVVS